MLLLTRIQSLTTSALACLALSFPSTAHAQTTADLQRVSHQLVEQLLPSPAQTLIRRNDIKTWMASLAPDGHWPDIRYHDRSPGSWATGVHLNRVVQLAEAYDSPADPLHADPALLRDIHSALGWWLAHDYRSSNWWNNEINVPRLTAFTLILMRSELSPSERTSALKIIARAKIRRTGQNRVWLAGNVLMRALLENDAPLARQARDAINAEVIITADEGIQVDYSFHQHGPQLQLGNYGLAFASDGLFWMQVLHGTSLAFDPDKAQLLRDYVFLGERTAVWKGAMDINSCGRQLRPNSPIQKGNSVASLLQRIPQPVNATPITGNTMFWRSDYMVDRRSDYYTSVKMSSLRTQGSEVINQENLSGRYLGDGALYLYKTGAEYQNIFPVWDWHKLPGVTCATDAPLRPINKTGTNPSAFVGGVTDGNNGIAAMIYDRDGVHAKKSWFFLPNRIVCLGADITGTSDQKLTTTINQCLLSGPVLAGHDDQSSSVPTGTRTTYPALQWAWHDGTGYVFLQPTNATLGGATQTGSWRKDVYDAGSPDTVSQEVFSLWINHGTQPTAASYAYVILPTASATETQTYSKTSDVKILADTSSLQAIRLGQTIGAVFYQSGQLTCAPGQQVAVDHPCLLLLTQTRSGSLRLTIADPTQKLTQLTLTWNGHPHTITLPSGLHAGQSIAVSMP